MIRLAVRCGPESAERVLAELLQLAPGGVEQEEGAGWVEYAIYGGAGELPDLGTLEGVDGDEGITVTSEEIPDDWGDRWRDFHEPIWIAERILIRPSWIEAESPALAEVVVDPGQAFGTGAHPTTRMCVELLLGLADAGEASGSLADLGTGSGVLAIVAAKLGFDPVIAVDHELAAIEATRENAEANAVRVKTARLNLRQEPPPAADTVVANLTAPLLRGLAAAIGSTGNPPANLVCSGLLLREAEAVASAFVANGLGERDRRVSGDWAALRFSA